MRPILPAFALAGALAMASAGCSAAVATGAGGPGHNGHHLVQARVAHHPVPVSYYLALGDSLSQGVQPDAGGASVSTQQGYADQLYAMLARRHPGLRLVKLGCAGETTATMIKGGICRYQQGSQLTAAESFLRANQRHTLLVTLDIGANDPGSCVSARTAGQLASCAFRSVPGTTANLTTILTRLRQAAPGVHIIAMNYYLPALAQWRNGWFGEAVARVSELAAAGYNSVLTSVYRSFGIPIADVFGAFHTAEFGPHVSVPGFGTLPRNVAEICQWTWACAGPPRGPNEHANPAGYEVIARSFLLAGAR